MTSSSDTALRRLFEFIGVILMIAIIITMVWLTGSLAEEPVITEPLKEDYLYEQGLRFEQRIEKVTENVYVAIGYALANSILITTDDGNIIIDTTESIEAAKEIKEEFDKISDAPVRAVIYTHGHPDHILGTSVFIEGVEDDVRIIAHESTIDFLVEQFGVLQEILNIRGMRQFGTYLPDELFMNAGLGPFLRFSHEEMPVFIFPNEVFSEEKKIEIGGVELILKHAPGETDDQILAWMPDQKILFSGDNYYPAFPNLYTIRGTSPRPIDSWIRTLDMMREMGAEYLVPSHIEPVKGAERIEELLTVYRDAIQYVHDSVIRGANLGKTPDQLVEEIELPPHLLEYPELRELYGKVSWSVRAIYSGYLGWFDGNATNLDPLPPRERSERIIALAGGFEKLLEETEKALEDGEYQWAAELSDILLEAEPGNTGVKTIKAEALIGLGRNTYNANARSYYFTYALELTGQIKQAGRLKVDREFAHSIPIEMIFENMIVRLDPEASADTETVTVFKMTDSGEIFTIYVRRGVAQLSRDLPDDPDLVVHVSEDVWKEITLEVTNPLVAIATGRMRVDDFGLFKLNDFSKLFLE